MVLFEYPIAAWKHGPDTESERDSYDVDLHEHNSGKRQQPLGTVRKDDVDQPIDGQAGVERAEAVDVDGLCKADQLSKGRLFENVRKDAREGLIHHAEKLAKFEAAKRFEKHTSAASELVLWQYWHRCNDQNQSRDAKEWSPNGVEGFRNRGSRLPCRGIRYRWLELHSRWLILL